MFAEEYVGKTPRVALPAVVEIGQIGHYKKGLTLNFD